MDAGGHLGFGGAHGAISCGRQYYLRQTVFAILGLKIGSAFWHVKPPYVPLDWSFVVIILHIHTISMQMDFHHDYNKPCNRSYNNQFSE